MTEETETLQPRSDPVLRTCTRQHRIAFACDLAVAVALLAFALTVRRSVPRDGLFWDDAWQALGATKASFSQLYVAGQTQPGFNLLLALWSRAYGTAPGTMVLPARIAGALGPFALYLVLRWFRYSRSVAGLMAAILAVCTAHVVFSTRVKSYSADVITVLLVAILVDRLSRRTWDARIAVIWAAIAITAAAMTAIGPLVVVAAGLIIALHPRDDFRLRIIAVGIQLVAITIYVRAIERTFNGGLEKDYWRSDRGFIAFSANPVRFGSEIARRLERVMQTFPGGPQPWPDVVVLVVAVGLGLASWRGRRAIATRFLVLAALLAMAGSVAGVVPFAPLYSGAESARITLWLIPLIAVGLAEILELVRTRVARRGVERHLFDGVMAIVAICVLFSGIGTTRQYPDGGRTATRYVMAHLAPRDAVWITAMYPFAVSAGVQVRLHADSRELVGFLPAFTDPRLIVLRSLKDQIALRSSVTHATRVWLPLAPGDFYSPYLSTLEATLRQGGFVRCNSTKIRSTVVERWDRNSADVSPCRTDHAPDPAVPRDYPSINRRS